MDMNDVVLRPYTINDIDTLQEVRRAAFAPIFQSFREIVGPEIAAVAFARADEEQADYLRKICGSDSDHHVFVAAIGAQIVGFVSWSTDETSRVGEIGLNAAHPDHSNRGLGQKMYEYALSEMRRGGMLVATVGTGGDASHAPARRAYQKVGFQVWIPSIQMYRRL